MAVENLTGEGNQETYEQKFCSGEFTEGIHNQLKCLSALNIFMSIFTFLENTLILVALQKESSLHPPTKLLFRCLATTDLCVGLFTEPFIVAYWMSVVNERWDICRHALDSSAVTGYFLCSVSLLTVTAISVDRLLALLLGLRYRQVVSLKRTYVIVTVFGVVSIVGATLHFWNYLVSAYYNYVTLTIGLVVSMFSYTKISITLRHQQIQVSSFIHVQLSQQGQPGQTSQLNIERYKKAAFSALWLQLTLVVCYLRYGVLAAFWTTSSFIFLARQFALTLVLLNSSLNPILYCWKITEVRQAVKDTIRQLCHSPN